GYPTDYKAPYPSVDLILEIIRLKQSLINRKSNDHVNTTFRLGEVYEMEETVRNYEKATKWYEKAAEQGHGLAQYRMGIMCQYYRRGIAMDYQEAYKEAAKWYQKAAEQRYPHAQNSLGWMYEYGFGVERDHEKATKCYQESCDMVK
ncbi:hypothetical protein GR268_46440, partial [Rhizobium leguminosarum]|nr:hypothetical protein [Rhizobium leguminosarum]